MDTDLLKVIDQAAVWLDIEGIEGVGQGTKDGNACIIVGCSLSSDEFAGQIPTRFMGYPVVFEEWGTVSAQDERGAGDEGEKRT